MNTYLVVTYVAILTFAISAGILWLCFVFEDINDRKHYKRLKNDAEYWMKVARESTAQAWQYETPEEGMKELRDWMDENK